MAQKAPDSQKQWEHQREDLLIAIDQLSQMTEVMNNVLSQVKQQVNVLDSDYPEREREREKNKERELERKKEKTQCDRRQKPKKTITNNNKIRKVDLVH